MSGRRLTIGVWLLAMVLSVNSACRDPSGPVAAPDPAAVSAAPPREPATDPAQELAEAIERSARYLAGLCDAEGRFRYRVHLDPTVALPPAYNELRHAGAVYALAQCQRRAPDPHIEAAMLRGVAFLRRECLGPVADQPTMLAVWPPRGRSDDGAPREAKLGGAGLALVALLSVEAVSPATVPREELRALARFLIFMQKPDGGYYSKYFADTGRSDAWQSEYYPGEAALGLLMLYRHDPQLAWLRSATMALDQIARRGAERPSTFPDQWYLLATEQVLAVPADAGVPVPRDTLIAFARRICTDMLTEQQAQATHAQLAGCYTPDGRSCPTATRLEGLLAAYQFLPSEDPTLAEPLRQSIDQGVQFLLRCQITQGPHAGAFPRVLRDFQPATEPTEGTRAQEIRIDYVQHALSALIRYEALSARGR
ncbi:MAG: hypothetical protein MUF48_13100 [Pirellulaceae bacterium]|jgi:hypothetical protein|nr:hypothetical protein [Pirellulaceae bacterium]